MKLTWQNVYLTEDGKYYRVNINIDTHHMHSEKMNLETAQQVLMELVIGD